MTVEDARRCRRSCSPQRAELGIEETFVCKGKVGQDYELGEAQQDYRGAILGVDSTQHPRQTEFKENENFGIEYRGVVRRVIVLKASTRYLTVAGFVNVDRVEYRGIRQTGSLAIASL